MFWFIKQGSVKFFFLPRIENAVVFIYCSLSTLNILAFINTDVHMYVLTYIFVVDIKLNYCLFFFCTFSSQSNERQFLKDFISGAPGSSGARLAAWLQPEPRLDPNK